MANINEALIFDSLNLSLFQGLNTIYQAVWEFVQKAVWTWMFSQSLEDLWSTYNSNGIQLYLRIIES